MLKYFLVSLMVVSAAFAVSPAGITGSGTSIGSPSPSDYREELIFEQGTSSGENGAWGSMWYEGLGQDMKVADNFKIDGSFAGYILTRWEEWFCIWYGSFNQASDEGPWAVCYDDGGSTPATTEPYEYGSSSGWHDDLLAGNGGLDYITDVPWADAWDWDDVTGTGSPDFYLWGYYPVYKTSAAIEDSLSGGFMWYFETDPTIYWFMVQFHAPNQPYGGPPDNSTSVVSGGMCQAGVSGANWNNIGRPMMFNLYGDVGIIDEDPPTITNTYPHDDDYPSGVPIDTWAGCHWEDGDPATNLGIDVAASEFHLYDGAMDEVPGTLTIDDTDLFDVIVDFEPDDDLNEGETYTVDTTTYDNFGNGPVRETWTFTTGYVSIAPASLGTIKAGFAE